MVKKDATKAKEVLGGVKTKKPVKATSTSSGKVLVKVLVNVKGKADKVKPAKKVIKAVKANLSKVVSPKSKVKAKVATSKTSSLLSKSKSLVAKGKSTKVVKTTKVTKAKVENVKGKIKGKKDVVKSKKDNDKGESKLVRGKGKEKGKGIGKGKEEKPKRARRQMTDEQKKAAAVKRQSRLEGKKDRIYRSVEDWEGNSDSDGSVDSGCMEENICFECGVLTNDLTINDDDDGDDENIMIICDKCSAEIHLKCLNLNIVPRKGFVCPRCREDEGFFTDSIKYDVYKPDRYNQGSKNITRESSFPIPKPLKNALHVEYVYSPSRPLDLAWGEMIEKGFMSVKNVFDYQTMLTLTHGTLWNTTKSGRNAEKFCGALKEIENKIGGNIISNLIDRNGRFDMRLPDFVIKQLGIVEKIQPILDKLCTIMALPKPQIRTQNVVFAPVGSAPQEWHIDDTPVNPKAPHRYFTILIGLNPIDENCGGTEIYHKQMKKGDLIRNRPGDAFVFNGSMLHRGQSNDGRTHRLFYYASFACRADTNIAV